MNPNFEQIEKKPRLNFYQQNQYLTSKDQTKCLYLKDSSTYEYSPVYQDDDFIQIKKVQKSQAKQCQKSSLFELKLNNFKKIDYITGNQFNNVTISTNNCRILRTYDKILQRYLQNLSLERDNTSDCLNFTNCYIFNNLCIQNNQDSLKEKIFLCSFSFFEKNKFIMRLKKMSGLAQFLQEILSKNYFQINQQILLFVSKMVDLFQEFIQRYLNQKGQHQNMKLKRKFSFQYLRENLKEQKNKIQSEMRELLQQKELLNKIYYSDQINYLNFKKVTAGVPHETVKFQFSAFMKSFSKIIVKLIAVDLVNNRDIDIDTNQTNSRQKQQYDNQVNDEERDKLKIKFINSYRSLNSVASFNVKELNLYDSKPDLWSEEDSQQEQGYITKKKRKYA